MYPGALGGTPWAAQLHPKKRTRALKLPLWPQFCRNLENWKKKELGFQVEGEDLLSDLPSALEEIPF